MYVRIAPRVFSIASVLLTREFQGFCFMRNGVGAVRSTWKLEFRTAGLFQFTAGSASRSFWGSPPGFIFSVVQSSSEITAMAYSSEQPFVIAPLLHEDEDLAEDRTSEGVVSGPSKQELPPEDEAVAQDGTSDGAVRGPSKQGSELLEACEDKYDGIIVDPDKLPMDVASFVSLLKASLSEWRHQGKRGVWLKVPIDHAKLVPAAIEEGFWYHHAEPTYIMLVYWIPETPCTLPANASHQVGIGAFVVNNKREVLAVQEKTGPLKGLGIWKMPTGLIHQGEDIFTGAMREVKEETGIDAKFLEVVGFRHAHHAAFEKSDLFFVCILRPLSSHIVIQESEIEAAQGKKGVWLKLPSERAKLVPAAIEAGFWYHHAEHKYVMLTYWIPETPCTLPPNASHQVGIGAFVVNDKREVLAVKETNGPYKGSGLWKMPTGSILQGENIFTGAMREVKEETGIDTEFLEVVGLRHSLNGLFGKSDLFLVCMLRPISSEIVIQESEIEAAQWMPVEEFVAQPKYQQNQMLSKMLSFCVASFEKKYKGFSTVQVASNSTRPPPALYYNVSDMK